MKRFASIVVVVGLFVALSVHAADVNWMYDYNGALTMAKAAKKLVLVDVYTDWCSWCKKLDRDVYSDKTVQDQLAKGFICVKINPEKNAKNKQVAEGMGVRGFPYTAFFDADGKKLKSFGGYVPAKEFSMILTQITINGSNEEVAAPKPTPKPTLKPKTKRKK